MKKRNMFVLFCSLICIAGVTYLGRFVKFIPILPFRIAALVQINLLNGLIAWIAMRITGMKINIDVRNKRQYAIGAIVALILSFFYCSASGFIRSITGGRAYRFFLVQSYL